MKLAIAALFSLFAATAVAAPDPQMREQRREQRIARFDHNGDGRLDRQERREAKHVRREHRRERREHRRERRREQRQGQHQMRQAAPAYMNPSQAPGAQ